MWERECGRVCVGERESVWSQRDPVLQRVSLESVSCEILSPSECVDERVSERECLCGRDPQRECVGETLCGIVCERDSVGETL